MEKKKLLVVVDMQNDFVTGVLGTKEAQAIVEPMAEYIKNFDGDVIFSNSFLFWNIHWCSTDINLLHDINVRNDDVKAWVQSACEFRET